MRKVIEFLPTLADGGVETLVKDYALELKKNNCEVVILLLENGKECANRNILENNNIRIISLYKLKSQFILRAIRHFGDETLFSILLLTILRIEKPDVLHIHMNLLHYLSPIRSKISGIRVFYTCHSLPKVYFTEGNERELLAAKQLVDSNNLIIFGIHDEMTRELKTLISEDNCKTLYNMVDYNSFCNDRNKNIEVRRNLGINENSFVVGFVGRMSDVKNPFFAVDVFQSILKKKANSVLVMIGDGYLLSEVKEYIRSTGLENEVIVLSNRTDVSYINQCFDAFIFPSKYEGFGIAVIEAQVSHIPCFVSDKVPAIVQISNNFSVIPLDSSLDEWADRIIEYEKKEWEILDTFDSRLIFANVMKYYFPES